MAKPAADKAAPAASAASVADPAPAAPATLKEPKKPAQPAAPAALKRQKSGFGMTFGSLLKQDTHAVDEEEETPVDAGDVHFTADELQLEWLAMCNRMPAKMRAMAYRLKNAQVHITEFPQVEVVLDNKPAARRGGENRAPHTRHTRPSAPQQCAHAHLPTGPSR